MKRMWINQPNTHQPLHHLHGTNVLAVPEFGNTARVYFLSGRTESQQVPALALSEGWRPDPKQVVLERLVSGLRELGIDAEGCGMNGYDTVDFMYQEYPLLVGALK